MPILSSAVIDDWLSEIFTAAGCPASEARLIAENLVDADASGHPSHGIVRVPRYIDYIANQTVRPACTYEVITQSGNLMLLDGQFSFGQVLGHHLVDEADRLASETGLAMIGLRHAGHLGRIGAWAEYLAEKGYISIHFVNVAGSRIVAPFGSKEACLSTAPVAIGVPNSDGDFILDFATSRVAEGKILVSQKTGSHLPPDAMVDGQGQDSDLPATIYGETAEADVPDPRAGSGAIQTFGEHKGSGLGIACELLAGALTGSGTNAKDSAFCNGMLSIVMDAERWEQGNGSTASIASEIHAYISMVRGSAPREAGQRVLVPGDKERMLRAQAQSDGICLDENIYSHLVSISRQFDVQTPNGV